MRKHLTLIGVPENARCRECGLEEESTFYILCDCNALAREKVLRQAYIDAANTREAELGALQHFCRSSGYL